MFAQAFSLVEAVLNLPIFSPQIALLVIFRVGVQITDPELIIATRYYKGHL